MKIVDKLMIITLILLFASCERRELTYYRTSEITILADWSQSGIKETTSGATVVFYPETGEAPIVVLMGNREHETVRLPLGRYNAIIFNRSFDDFGTIGFCGKEKYGTLEAYASKVEIRSNEIVQNPEEFAADCVEGFEVTETMLGNYTTVMRKTRVADVGDRYILRFTPLRLTRKVKAIISIRGLNNLHHGICTIDGIPSSVYLSTGKASETLITQQFELENPVFTDGSPFDGIMTSSFSVFDLDRNFPHCLHLKAWLVDGETIFEEDLKEVRITETTDDEGEIILYITASLPEPLPDVKPQGGSDSGFDAGVDDWNEPIEKEIPIE